MSEPRTTPATPGPTTDDARRAITAFLERNRVLRPEAFELVAQASRLLEQARREAGDLMALAHAEARKIQAQAQELRRVEAERGYQEGWQAGRREQAEALATAGATQARTMPSLDERIGLLVTRTLNKVLEGRDVDERFFAAVVQRVLRAAREEKFLRMRVAPDQLEAAAAAVERVVAETGAPNLIEVVSDGGLRHGACLVESPHGVIDASLDTQLESIRRALTAVWRSTGGQPPR